MMIWILIFRLLLNLVGSILLGKVVIKTDNEISAISGTPLFDGNPKVANSLKKDRKIRKDWFIFPNFRFAIQLIYNISKN